ncbi:hypothetical protein MYX64_08440 [Nitrospinae bacterium AH_259_B05_G02_I21]|nr:hypothetical protein [Nitrospinae bacterium AH_259_B05_G02_I21]MDA2932415.1 hypothetical protein [Nitrospinae bacterium AH-259-F20]
MPAPKKTNKHTPASKAHVKALILEGYTHREIVELTGVGKGTVSRWGKEDITLEELKQGKKTVEILEHDIRTNAAVNSLLTQELMTELLERLHDPKDNFTDKDLDLFKILSRAGVDRLKEYGIVTDKVLIRDGIVDIGHQTVSPATMLALLLSKANADREAANRLEQERKTFEASKDKGKAPDIIDVKPSS